MAAINRFGPQFTVSSGLRNMPGRSPPSTVSRVIRAVVRAFHGGSKTTLEPCCGRTNRSLPPSRMTVRSRPPPSGWRTIFMWPRSNCGKSRKIYRLGFTEDCQNSRPDFWPVIRVSFRSLGRSWRTPTAVSIPRHSSILCGRISTRNR